MTTSAARLGAEVAPVLAGGAGPVLAGCLDVSILHGNGNIIAVVVLDGPGDHPRPELGAAAVALSEAVGSVRVDGVLFFYPGHRRGRRMVFFDRDGTYETMCGNGLRCLTRYAADTGRLGRTGVVVTDDGDREVRVDGDDVEVDLGPAREVAQLGADRWFAFTGVAHLVVFVEDTHRLAGLDVRTEGGRLRRDEVLARTLGHPEGLHVDYVAVDGPELVVRTYEVGVEDETLCCGTGVAAAAHVGRVTGRTGLPVRLRTPGGRVRVDDRDGRLRLSGPVGYLLRSARAESGRATAAEGGR